MLQKTENRKQRGAYK